MDLDGALHEYKHHGEKQAGEGKGAGRYPMWVTLEGALELRGALRSTESTEPWDWRGPERRSPAQDPGFARLPSRGTECAGRDGEGVWTVPLRSPQIWGCHEAPMVGFKQGNDEDLIWERRHREQRMDWLGRH